MSARRIPLIVVAVVGGLLLVSSLSGDDADLAFSAPAQERSVVDVGEPGASLGDMTVLSGPLLDGDEEEAGRIDGVCTITSRADDEGERRQRCAITLTVGNGETELQLAGVGRVAAEDVVYSVVGGAGEYADAGGEAAFDFSDRDRARIAVSLED